MQQSSVHFLLYTDDMLITYIALLCLRMHIFIPTTPPVHISKCMYAYAYYGKLIILHTPSLHHSNSLKTCAFVPKPRNVQRKRYVFMQVSNKKCKNEEYKLICIRSHLHTCVCLSLSFCTSIFSSISSTA